MKTPTDETAPSNPPDAAAPLPEIETRTLSIAAIVPSPTNPRKTFNAVTQAELEASMREHGFTMSMLLVRPLPRGWRVDADEENHIFTVRRGETIGELMIDSNFPTRKEADARAGFLNEAFELVTGERRYRAAKTVGIAAVPCILRELSDQEVLELQLIENLQRADLTAIEEAEGFQRLLSLRDEQGAPIYTNASLAQRIGKSLRHVERRAKLCLLDGEARTAVETGELPVNTALLIARIPDEKLRAKATREILHPKYQEAPLSFRRAQELVQQEFMRDLREAPFEQKDPDLVPVETDGTGQRCAGGACTDCPLKVGNAKALFEEEIPSGLHNMCMNPRCFERKREAGWEQWQQKETDPDKHQRALTEKECGAIYNYGDQRGWNSPLVDLAERPDSHDLKPGVEAPGTWRQLTKGTEIEVLVARDRNGRTHRLVNRDAAIQAAELNEHKIFKRQQKEKEKTEEERKAEVQKQQKEHAKETRIEQTCIGALVEKACGTKKLPEGFWKLAIGNLMSAAEDSENLHEVANRRGYKEGDSEGHDTDYLAALAEKMPENQLLGFAVELLIGVGRDWATERFEAAQPWAKLFGVDLKAVAKATAAEIKAEEKAAAEQAKNATQLSDGMGWRVGPSELECFTFNEHDVCTAPDELELSFPKSSRVKITLFVAGDERGWYGGRDLHSKMSGSSGAAKRGGDMPAPTRIRALIDEAYGALEWLRKEGAPAKVINLMNDYVGVLLRLEPTQSATEPSIDANANEETEAPPPKRGKKSGKLTPEGRARLAAAMKARWAARKKKGGAK